MLFVIYYNNAHSLLLFVYCGTEPNDAPVLLYDLVHFRLKATRLEENPLSFLDLLSLCVLSSQHCKIVFIQQVLELDQGSRFSRLLDITQDMTFTSSHALASLFPIKLVSFNLVI